MFQHRSQKGAKFPQILGIEPRDIAARLSTIYENLEASSSEQVIVLWRQQGFINPPITELELEEQRKRECNTKMRAQQALCERVLEAYEEKQNQDKCQDRDKDLDKEDE